MREIIGYILVALGIQFIGFGTISIFRFKNVFARILVSSKVDTVGFILINFGIMLKMGFSFFTFKVLLILVAMTFVSPLITHSIARAAYETNPEVKGDGIHDY